jgi:hypothetical protein
MLAGFLLLRLLRDLMLRSIRLPLIAARRMGIN